MLSDKEILQEIEKGNIVIDPFERKNLGSNSYDVTLSKKFKTYDIAYIGGDLDIKKKNELYEFEINDKGYRLLPNILYLAVTNEYTETYNLAPMINGRSSLGRLGLSIHQTAGFGDAGFKGQWTLEITVIHPIIIYPDIRIAQVCWFKLGEVLTSYDKKISAKYNASKNEGVIESRIYKDLQGE